MLNKCSLLSILFFAGLLGCHSTPEEASPPNIIFILADDLGWNQLECYGGAPYETPHINRLAESGMRFTQAYSGAAVCSPTRAAIMSGLHPARLHLTDFLKGEDFPDSLLVQPEWQKFLPLETVTIAEVLKQKGYRTAHFGKWHLSKDKRPPISESHNPLNQGFDEQLITYKPTNKTDPEDDPHNVDTITNRAIAFLHRNRDSTFFLYLSHNAIHAPIMESAARVQHWAADSTMEKMGVDPMIAAMTSRLDEGVGSVLKTLKELGLEEETIVIFYSDNGGKSDYATQKPFRAGKGWLYEGGIRVPLIIRWPGKVEPGTTNPQMITSVDFYPTLSAIAGQNKPDANADGQNFLPLLFSDSAALKERNLYWHYPHYHKGSGMVPASAIRSGDYKLIEWHQKALLGKQGALALYNVTDDPGETNNLADEAPERTTELYNQLKQWRKEVGAQMPVVRSKTIEPK